MAKLATKQKKSKSTAKKSGGASQSKAVLDAMAQMLPKLRVKSTQVSQMLSDHRAENIKYWWNLGKVVAEVKNNPEDYVGRDGRSGLELLEIVFDRDKNSLRKATRFADTYGKEELNHLVSLKNKVSGYQLNYSHVSPLLRIAERQQREAMASQAVDKGWDPDMLTKKVQGSEGRKGDHGKSHQVPKSLEAHLRQVAKLTQQWTEKGAEVWWADESNVFNDIMNATAEQLDMDMWVDLTYLRSGLVNMAEMARSQIQKLEKTIEYVGAKLQERGLTLLPQDSEGRAVRSLKMA